MGGGERFLKEVDLVGCAEEFIERGIGVIMNFFRVLSRAPRDSDQ